MEIVFNNKTGKWETKPDPYITIEVQTKEDYDFLQAAVDFYNLHTEKEERKKGCEYCTGYRKPIPTDGGVELEVVKLLPLPAINLTTGEKEKTAPHPLHALRIRVFDELEDFVPIHNYPMCGRLLKED